MRTTLNISLPSDLYLFVRERVDAGSFASASEYIRALVRSDFEHSGGQNRERPKLRGPRRVNDIMMDSSIGSDEY